ncbi:MAG: 50S ribosomal protein L6 [Simkaniaceae bacterium]
MSRLGKRPISLPKGVEISVKEDQVIVKGPKGTINQPIVDGVNVQVEEGHVKVSIDEAKLDYPMHGLYRSLILNAITGVHQGYEKKLTLIGVGYRAQVKGNSLDLQLGFSHPSEMPIPDGIKVDVEKSTMITISGIDKQKVGQFAAEIRALKPPEPYKGKGVRYENEYVRKKAGKAAKGK